MCVENLGKLKHLNLLICTAGSRKPIVLFTNTINIDSIEANCGVVQVCIVQLN